MNVKLNYGATVSGFCLRKKGLRSILEAISKKIVTIVKADICKNANTSRFNEGMKCLLLRFRHLIYSSRLAR